MNIFSIVFTVFNFCCTVASVVCMIIAIRQTRKQSDLMSKQIEAAYKQIEETSKQTLIAQKQLEESAKPNSSGNWRLDKIVNSIQQLDSTVSKVLKDSK